MRNAPLLLAFLSASSLACWSSYREYSDREPPPAPWECPPPSTPAELAAIVDGSLHLVALDGSAHEEVRVDRPLAGYGGQAVTAAGPWVAALFWTAATSPGEAAVDLVVACRTGGIAWRTHETLPYEAWGNEASVRGNTDGRFVFSFRFGEGSLVVAASPDGVTTVREPYLVRGRPARAGGTLVWRADASSTEEYEWFDSVAGTFRPTGYADGGAGSRLALAETLAYGLRGGRELRVEIFDDAWTIPVTWPPGDVEYLPLERGDGERWALIEERDWTTGTVSAYSTVDVVGRTARRFTFRPPAGLEAWSDPRDSTPGMWIAQDGSVFEVFRDRRQASLMRTRDGTTWERVGRPITDVDIWYAAEGAGAFLFLGSVSGSGGVTWDPGADADALAGGSVQLTAPARTTVLPATATHLRLAHDGRAASGWVDRRLERFDAATGETTETGVTYADDVAAGRIDTTFAGGEDRRTPAWW
ncbi:MAG: hypothetical protein HY905_14020 [Deltaproteobacteria bacterium]|nr:hypothetical protein [Deltaproteobacteria bacterium]